MSTDQTGLTRPQGVRCDVGAYEFRTGFVGGGGTILGGGAFGGAPGTGADLQLIAVPPDPVFVGQRLVYEFVIANRGPEAARDVFLINELPVETQVLGDGTPSNCSGATTLSCPLGTIPAGSSVRVSLAARALRAGRLRNRAGVASFNNETPDPDATDNLVEILTDVTRRRSTARFAVSLASVQNPFAQRGRLRVKVRPQVRETIVAAGGSRINRAARFFRLIRARRTVRAGRVATLRPRLRRSYRRAVRRTLRRNRRVFARVRLRGRTSSGRTYRTSRRVRLVE